MEISRPKAGNLARSTFPLAGQSGNPPSQARPAGPYGLAGYRKRTKGFSVCCDRCFGKGCIPVKGLDTIFEVCCKCDGAGRITISQPAYLPTWGDVAWYSLMTAIAMVIILHFVK